MQDDEGSKKSKASLVEIEAAIKALMAEDIAWFKIQMFARFRAYAGCPWDGDDLVQESLLTLLEGNRTWDKKVDFAVLFQGIIRSVASHKYEEWKKDKEDESHVEMEEPATPLGTMLDSEKCAEFLRLLRERFKDDPKLLTVLECWEGRFNYADALQYTEITVEQYEKIIRRVEGALKSVREKVEGGTK